MACVLAACVHADRQSCLASCKNESRTRMLATTSVYPLRSSESIHIKTSHPSAVNAMNATLPLRGRCRLQAVAQFNEKAG